MQQIPPLSKCTGKEEEKPARLLEDKKRLTTESVKIKKCAIYPLVTEHNGAIVPEIETLDFVFLKCPPGVQSGSKIEWKSADGMTFETRIPFGVAPGEMFEGLNLKDTDNLSPSTPKDSYRTRQSKNSSRCSIFGINGKIDPL